MTTKSNLVVDIGNSKIKTAVFEGDQIIAKYNATDLEDVSRHFASEDYRYIFSSVGKDDESINNLFLKKDYLILKSTTPLPIQLDYKTPNTLGIDRIAAAVGAHYKYPGDVLVIDAGTCVTYELVESEGLYRGGIIAPGLRMRMKAMSHFTRQLPDISENWQDINVHNPGKTTQECLLNGSYQAMINEINGFIDQFTEEYPQLSVILTGGDARYFESKLKAPIFADFDLVLSGLNRILNHNK